MIRLIPRTSLCALAVALALVACEQMNPADPTDEVPASELIEGEWVVTKYRITYDAVPDNPIELTDSSDIDFTFKAGSYGYVCFPACLGIIKAGSGTYTVDEARKTFRFNETHLETAPEYTHLASQLSGEWRATYQFPSRDRVRLDARIQALSQGVFVQASLVIEAERD